MRTRLVAVVVMLLASCSAALAQRPPATGPATRPAAAAPAEPPGAVVFVVDVSASMTGTIDAVRAEVAKRVNAMPPSQWFAIVVSRGKGSMVIGEEGMRRATDDVKKGALAELGRVKLFGTNNMPGGLLVATTLGADEIWLLTDGVLDQDHPRLQAAVKRATAQRKMRIHTAPWVTLSAPGKSPELVDRLARIAWETGGDAIGEDGKPMTPDAKEPGPR